MKTEQYVAQLSPSQLEAHRRILALTKVYDAAAKVVKASEILEAVPDFDEAQNVFDEAMSALGASLWNTQFILKEPYPWLESNEKAEWEARGLPKPIQTIAKL